MASMPSQWLQRVPSHQTPVKQQKVVQRQSAFWLFSLSVLAKQLNRLPGTRLKNNALMKNRTLLGHHAFSSVKTLQD
jgi:hypothetical protein